MKAGHLNELPLVDFLLLGGGLASATAAETLRAAGAEGSIAPAAPAPRQPEGRRTPVPVGQGNPSDIFISYEHQDRKHARALASALAAASRTSRVATGWDHRCGSSSSAVEKFS